MMNDQLLRNDLFWAKNRYETFKYWPFGEKSKCSAVKMAKAGFFACDESGDAARCYFCLKTLEGWEEDDDPMDEHRRHKPSCQFVKLNKAETAMTIDDIFALLCDRWKNVLTAKHEEDLLNYDKVWNTFEKFFTS